jgi:hypothetical protein
MKLNRSLAISNNIQELKMGNIIGMLEEGFPAHIFKEKIVEEKIRRDRFFSYSNTLLTMVLTSVQQDKSLQNSVDLYYLIHQKNKLKSIELLENDIIEQKCIDEKSFIKTAGRPKHYTITLPKSLEKDISLNTAAYSKARTRLPIKLVGDLFENSLIENAKNDYSHWHGLRVFIGDGTYLQMQDSETLRAKYEVKHNGIASMGYPQGLLEAVIERGTGQIYCFDITDRHTSELPVLYKMLDKIPPKSVILLDDLYNCYEILYKCIRLEIEIVVPAKRDRNFEHVKTISEGDEIVKIKAPIKRSPWLKDIEKPESITVRLINCKSPDGKEYNILTTILDENIGKNEFQLFYLTRWDIEIGIREVKTIMDINILRSKTPDMALKELSVALSTYNLIRKIIYAAIKDLPFSPKEDFIYQFYKNNKALLIDKKGRVYHKWSTGRKRTQNLNIEASASKA